MSSSIPLLPGDAVKIAHYFIVDSAGKLPRKKRLFFLDSCMFFFFFSQILPIKASSKKKIDYTASYNKNEVKV